MSDLQAKILESELVIKELNATKERVIFGLLRIIIEISLIIITIYFLSSVGFEAHEKNYAFLAFALGFLTAYIQDIKKTSSYVGFYKKASNLIQQNIEAIELAKKDLATEKNYAKKAYSHV